MWRLRLLAFVAGAASIHLLARLPHPAWLAALLLVGGAACFALVRWRGHTYAMPWVARMGWPLLCLLLGVAYAGLRADYRLHDRLADAVENMAVPVTFLVTGLANVHERGQRFDAELISAPGGIPRRVALSWYADKRQAPQAVIPGQVWHARAVFKRPHGNLNPHGFDFEALMFERGLRAMGNLRGQPVLLEERAWAGFDVVVQRMRHYLRAAMQPALADRRYGAVIMALAMGDQASVDKQDWTVFNRTGITHLVSISGLHVTMMAALGGALVLVLWARLSWRGMRLAERSPAQIAGAAAALILAWAYCLIAGWGIPAQRTFFMLAVIAGAAILRLPLSGSRVLVLAAALVCLLDPWAPLAAGFWLSFGAVAMLIVSGSGRWRRRPDDTGGGWRTRWQSARERLREGAMMQGALTVGLLPLLALLFQQVSLVSPIANAFAIPAVSLVVTPLALAAMFLCAIPGLEVPGLWLATAAHQAFAWMMVPIEALSALPGSNYPLAAAPWPWILLALGGAIWSLQPRGLPGRWLALCLVAPVLLYRPARPAEGEWRLAALDVGQGSAIVIETRRTTVLFDTGPRYGETEGADAGDRVIWPYLRARGVRRLDSVVVSHGDLDHVGGLQSVLLALPTAQLIASYDIAGQATARGAPLPLASDASLTMCAAGQSWHVDGVTFRMLHPEAAVPGVAAARNSKERNEASCVLHVQGAFHSAVLTGDIAMAQEDAIVAREPITADVVITAHHGSKGSSSPAFVAAMHAVHAVAQVGYLNRYRHPHPSTAGRWQAAGARFHRSDRDGAVVFSSGRKQLSVERERERRRRYWHGS